MGLACKGIRAGLSPRVRGNRQDFGRGVGVGGSIPACAGEPAAAKSTMIPSSVYPRVCGGTHCVIREGYIVHGLSPRVRGNPARPPQRYGGARSIPACAGEPSSRASGAYQSAVYPRVCGGTAPPGIPLWMMRGLSPRVRGNRVGGNPSVGFGRSIPACAGEPHPRPSVAKSPGVYPRVCGGTGSGSRPASAVIGLSPRVRGNPYRLGFR